MPEWPEVTITTRALQRLCAGKTILRVEVTHVLKHNISPFALIEKALSATVNCVHNKGKNIIFELSDGNAILSHMMLTGSWSTTENNHVCVTLVFANDLRLYYRDTRRFGRLDFCAQTMVDDHLSKIKPDMFTLTETDFVQAMRQKNRTGAYSCIMDQNAVLSGVGNYVAAESLYRACIHPKCKISKLTDAQLLSLLEAIRSVCTQSVECQGVSVSDYVTIEGSPGTFQDLLCVYKRSIHKLKINGRSCYWDPDVQTIL